MEVCPSVSGCLSGITEALAEERGLKLRLEGWVFWAESGKRISWWRKQQVQVHGGWRRHGEK